MSTGYVNIDIALGVYPVVIELVIATNVRKANAYFRKRYYSPREDYSGLSSKHGGLCRMTNGRIGILLHKNSGVEAAVHECTHAVCFALAYLGINFGDVNNNEVLAYPVGFLSARVLDELRKRSSL